MQLSENLQGSSTKAPAVGNAALIRFGKIRSALAGEAGRCPRRVREINHPRTGKGYDGGKRAGRIAAAYTSLVDKDNLEANIKALMAPR